MSEPATKSDIDRAVLAVILILTVVLSILFIGTVHLIGSQIEKMQPCSMSK